MSKDTLSWATRIRLCWDVLVKGIFKREHYKTIHEQEQWDICRQRDKEMNATTRPRTYIGYGDPHDEQ
jgi:hypothetical protein